MSKKEWRFKHSNSFEEGVKAASTAIFLEAKRCAPVAGEHILKIAQEVRILKADLVVFNQKIDEMEVEGGMQADPLKWKRVWHFVNCPNKSIRKFEYESCFAFVLVDTETGICDAKLFFQKISEHDAILRLREMLEKGFINE